MLVYNPSNLYSFYNSLYIWFYSISIVLYFYINLSTLYFYSNLYCFIPCRGRNLDVFTRRAIRGIFLRFEHRLHIGGTIKEGAWHGNAPSWNVYIYIIVVYIHIYNNYIYICIYYIILYYIILYYIICSHRWIDPMHPTRGFRKIDLMKFGDT